MGEVYLRNREIQYWHAVSWESGGNRRLQKTRLRHDRDCREFGLYSKSQKGDSTW